MAVDDAYTVSLLHFDGANNSTTFTDESGKTWTASGNAKIVTAQSVYGGACGSFDGTNSYISSPDSADWQLDGGSNNNEWTVDFRIRYDTDPGTGYKGIISQWQNASNYWNIFLLSNSIYLYFYVSGSNTLAIINSFNPADATWYHVAIVKQGTTGYKMFVDGTQIGSTQTDTDTMPNIAGNLEVGRIVDSASNAYYHKGWLDELRISKGIARWTANFTPPDRAYGLKPTTTWFFMHNVKQAWDNIGGIYRPRNNGLVTI